LKWVSALAAAGAHRGSRADRGAGGVRGHRDPGFRARVARAGAQFYGALRVRDNGPATQLDATRTLTHGTINHGEQFLNPARRDLPTTYYGPETGVGLAIREKTEDQSHSG